MERREANEDLRVERESHGEDVPEDVEDAGDLRALWFITLLGRVSS
jgi:hypothetical protein